MVIRLLDVWVICMHKADKMLLHKSQAGYALLSIMVAVLSVGLIVSQSLFSKTKIQEAPYNEMEILNSIKDQIDSWGHSDSLFVHYPSSIDVDHFRDLMSRNGILIPKKYDIVASGVLTKSDNDVTGVYSSNENSLPYYKILIKKVETNYDVTLDSEGNIQEIGVNEKNSPTYVVIDGFDHEKSKYIKSITKIEKISKSYLDYKKNMSYYMDPLKVSSINYGLYLSRLFGFVYDANGFTPISINFLKTIGLDSFDAKDAWGNDISFCPEQCGGIKDANAIVFKFNMPQSGSVNVINY